MPKRGTAMPGGRSNSARPAKAWTQWHDQAACAELSSRLFYGHESESQAERTTREESALAVCETCPVLSPCRAHAMNLPEMYGVWGGTTEAHRKGERRWSRAQRYDEARRAS